MLRSGRGRRSAAIARSLLALALLASAGSLALVAASAAKKSHAAGQCPQLFGSFSLGNWPPACWRPYGPSSPFNTPIHADPRLAPESAAIVAYMRSRGWSFEGDRSHRLTIDTGGSRPVYWARNSDPQVALRCHGEPSCRAIKHLHIPAGAQPQNESDGHMTVVDQSAGREYDFWQASVPRKGAMTASAASSIPIGADFGTGLGGHAEAANLGLLGGLIRAPELAAGRIEHALATTAECVQSRDVWPASGRGDAVCSGRRRGPHFGSLLQLNMSDAEIASSGAPSWQLTIMTAMAHYGIYVVDTNGGGNREMSLLNEDDQSVTSFGFPGQMRRFVASVAHGGSQATGIPIDISKFRVIAPCVPRRTC